MLEPLILVLSDLLGNRGMSNRFRAALGETGIDWISDVKVEPIDYRGVHPLIRRFGGSTRDVLAAARRALERHDLPDGCIALVNGWELGLAALSDPRITGIVLAMDTLPTTRLLTDAGLLDGTLSSRVLRRSSGYLHCRVLAANAEKIRGILPMSRAVATAAQKLLPGIATRPSAVTYSPQCYIADAQARPPENPRFRALFVANHFHRKGAVEFGEACRIARRSIAMEGVVVSNAETAPDLARDFDLTHIGGITDPAEMHQIYRSADLTVLPTRADQIPNVLAESIAAGTPVLATPVGAIPELVVPGETGWLLDRNPSGQSIAEAMIGIATDEDLVKLRERSIAFAGRVLSWDRFVASTAMVVRAALESTSKQ